MEEGREENKVLTEFRYIASSLSRRRPNTFPKAARLRGVDRASVQVGISWGRGRWMGCGEYVQMSCLQVSIVAETY
jgi:hypothetical protein